MKKVLYISLLALGGLYTNDVAAQSEATFYTSMGTFTADLTDTLTPVTVDSFIARASEGFYDGLIFHRVINDFMIQGGDPAGNGSGDAGYKLPDEFTPKLKNVTQALAMANAGPNTASCQFYINLKTNAHLDNKYTVFGMVTNNFNVVQDIGSTPTGAKDKPLTDVVIDSIRITRYYTSVSNTPAALGVHVYPNPNAGVFTIDLPANTKVEVVNMQGQLVYTKQAIGKLEVYLQNQAKGLYIIRLSNAGGKGEMKVIVQ
jgi:cyclophilin family peptidyl-prolyl cis-trans isomerase